MKNNVVKVFLLSLILTSLATPVGLFASQSIIMGTIQFPKEVSTVPMIRVRAGGKIVPYDLCEIDQHAKTLTFRVPRYARQDVFYLVITEAIDFEVIKSNDENQQSNTIRYFKIPALQKYKLYMLKWMPKPPLKTITPDKAKHQELEYYWAIQEFLTPPDTGRIPDDAIIVTYDPTYVEAIQGGSAFELPTIMLKKDLLALHGSEDQFMENSYKRLFSSMDVDTFHSSMNQIVKNDKQRNLIAIPVI